MRTATNCSVAVTFLESVKKWKYCLVVTGNKVFFFGDNFHN